MKLLSCKIENFGVLSGLELDFHDGVNCILRENGKGKTTLAAFICAMLYGMDSVRQNDKTLKPRAHYAPWNKGKFGGSLSLSCSGRIYRIDRVFDASSAAHDSLECYDLTNGVQKTVLEPSPGEALMGIPKDAFLRTAFLSGNDEGSSEGLLPKMNRLINGSEEKDLFGKTDALLQKMCKKYKAERGRGGLLDELADRRKDARRELENCLACADAAEKYEAEKREAFLLQKSAEEKLDLCEAYADALLYKKTHEEYLARAEDAKKKLEEFIKQNKDRQIDDKTLQTCEELLPRIEWLREKSGGDLLEKGEQAELERLERVFSDSSVTEETIDGIALLVGEREKEKEALARSEALLESEEYRTLHERFGSRCPSDGEIAELDGLYKDYSDAKSALDLQNEQLFEKAKKAADQKRFPKSAVFAAGASVILLILGVVFLVFQLPLSWLWLLAGAVCALIALLLFTKPKRRQEVIKEDAALKERCAELRGQLGDRLNSFGYFGSDLPLLLSALKEDRTRYLLKKDGYAQAERERERIKEAVRESDEKIDAFFSACPLYVERDAAIRLKYLREDLKRYRTLADKKQHRIKDAEKDKEELKKLCASFALALLPFEPSIPEKGERAALERLKELAKKRKELESALKARTADARDFHASHPYPEIFPDDIPNEEEKAKLKQALLICRARIASLDRKIEEQSRIADRTQECRETLTRTEQELEKQGAAYRILTETRALLKQAEDNLLGRYTGPLREAFEKYAGMLDDALAQKVFVNPKDLTLVFEREGGMRSADLFSDGFRAMADVCLRLAMIDTAYGEEPPFLILDDPFAALDDANLRRALRALQTLSQSTQILYFTCHSARGL